MDRFLNGNEDLPLLKRYAFLGSRSHFDSKLHFLERYAEREKWRFKNKGNEDAQEEFNVLFYYIIHTFDRCYKQGKIVISDDEKVALFNTGLLTPNDDEIYCLFTASDTYDADNPFSNYWYLNKFVSEQERDFMQLGLKKPEMATYFDSYNELYFDPDLEISLNFDHIYDDNYSRLPPSIQMLEKSVACQVFDGFLSHTKKRIRRNSRIPVPQFYRDKIMFLIPVQGFDKTPIVLALEKINNGYRANTVLTMNMAYNCARLLTRPESNWLLVE